MLFDEKKHERGREDEVSHATNFLFSRIQELEATVLSQRMALESSRQRELGLHNTVAGFQQLIASRSAAALVNEEKLVHLTSLVESLKAKNAALLEDNDHLRRRLESISVGNSASSPNLGGTTGPAINMNQSFGGAAEVSKLLSNASFSFSDEQQLIVLGKSKSSPLPGGGDLASTTQQLAFLQQQYRECNKYLNVLVGVVNDLLATSTPGGVRKRGDTAIPSNVKEGIAEVCAFIFERDGSLPTFLYEYVKKSGSGNNNNNSSSGLLQQHRAALDPNHHQNAPLSGVRNASGGDGAHHTATVQMLLRRNDELQQRLLDLAVSQ